MKRTMKSDRRFTHDEVLSATLRFLMDAREMGLKFKVAGSMRRGLETVGDLDIVADGKEVFRWYILVGKYMDEMPWAMGAAMCDFTLNGVPVNIRFFDKKDFESGMFFLTGPKEFNIKMRVRAQEMGMMLSQYGLFKDGEPLKLKSEMAIMEALGLEYVKPEERV